MASPDIVKAGRIAEQEQHRAKVTAIKEEIELAKQQLLEVDKSIDQKEEAANHYVSNKIEVLTTEMQSLQNEKEALESAIVGLTSEAQLLRDKKESFDFDYSEQAKALEVRTKELDDIEANLTDLRLGLHAEEQQLSDWRDKLASDQAVFESNRTSAWSGVETARRELTLEQDLQVVNVKALVKEKEAFSVKQNAFLEAKHAADEVISTAKQIEDSQAKLKVEQDEMAKTKEDHKALVMALHTGQNQLVLDYEILKSKERANDNRQARLDIAERAAAEGVSDGPSA